MRTSDICDLNCWWTEEQTVCGWKCRDYYCHQSNWQLRWSMFGSATRPRISSSKRAGQGSCRSKCYIDSATRPCWFSFSQVVALTPTRGPRQPNPRTKRLAIGTWNVVLLGEGAGACAGGWEAPALTTRGSHPCAFLSGTVLFLVSVGRTAIQSTDLTGIPGRGTWQYLTGDLILLLGDFDAHMGSKSVTCWCGIGRNNPSLLSPRVVFYDWTRCWPQLVHEEHHKDMRVSIRARGTSERS